MGLQKRMVKAMCKRTTGDSNTLQICCDEGIYDCQEGLLVYLHGVANSRINHATESKSVLVVIIL